MALIDDLVSYWEMEETGQFTTRTDSHGPHDLAAGDNATDGTGIQGNGIDFPGPALGGRLFVADHADFQIGSDPVTFAGWVQIRSAAVSSGIFGKGNTTDGEYVLTLNDTNGFLRYGGWAAAGFGSGVTAEVAEDIIDSAFHFFVAWFDPSASGGTFGLRVDAFSEVTAVLGAPVYSATGAAFRISTSQMFRAEIDGVVDEFGMWRRLLTSDEKTWLYNSGAGRTYADVVAGIGDASVGAKLIFRNRDYV